MLQYTKLIHRNPLALFFNHCKGLKETKEIMQFATATKRISQ